MTTLVIATRNAHKVQEIHAMLGDAVACRSLAEFPGAPDVVEDAGTFAGNAKKKATSLAEWLSTIHASHLTPQASAVFVLADDSGLEVDALGGAPGVYSARFAALDSSGPGNSPDAENNAKLLRLLAAVPLEKRTARFRCVLALVPVGVQAPDAGLQVPPSALRLPRFFEGACEGHIGFVAAGCGGFGYDPLFVPQGFTRTFAELGADEKNRLSHRARALEQLRRHLRSPASRSRAEAGA